MTIYTCYMLGIALTFAFVSGINVTGDEKIDGLHLLSAAFFWPLFLPFLLGCVAGEIMEKIQ